MVSGRKSKPAATPAATYHAGFVGIFFQSPMNEYLQKKAKKKKMLCKK
jgi:hypothetical protein